MPQHHQVRPIFLQLLACMLLAILHHGVSAWFFHYELNDPTNNHYRLLYWFSIFILLLTAVRLNLGIIRMPALITTYHLIFLNVLIRSESISLVPASYAVCVSTTIFTYVVVSVFALIMHRA